MNKMRPSRMITTKKKRLGMMMNVVFYRYSVQIRYECIPGGVLVFARLRIDTKEQSFACLNMCLECCGQCDW